MTPTHPTSFRLRRETLEQLDRVAELLATKLRSQLAEHPDDPHLLSDLSREPVSRSQALTVAISDTLRRLERELDAAPRRLTPYRTQARRGRGMWAGLGRGSAVEELIAERRAEAAAEDRAG